MKPTSWLSRLTQGWRAQTPARVDLSFDVKPARAIEHAKRDAFAHYNASAAVVRALVVDALDKGWGIPEAARELAARYDRDIPGAPLTMPSGAIARDLKTWAKAVAHYEIARAHTAGTFALYRSAGVKTVRWMTGKCCDRCEAVDDMVLDVGATFPGVNVDGPPAHEGCSCALVPADEDLGDWRGTPEQRAAAKRGNNPP